MSSACRPSDGTRREKAREDGSAQADESNGSGQGYGGRRQEHGEQDADGPRGTYRYPQRCRRIVAEREHIHPARADERESHRNRDDGRRTQEGLEAQLRQAATPPRQKSLSLFTEQHEQRRGRCLKCQGQRATGEYEPGRARARATRQAENDGRGHETAYEGHRPRCPDRHRDAERRHCSDRQVRTGRHAQRVGGGEGVASQRLHEHTGDAEGDPDCHPRRQSRDPRPPQHVGIRENGAAGALGQVPRGHDDEHQRERQEGSDGHGEAAPAGRAGGGCRRRSIRLAVRAHRVRRYLLLNRFRRLLGCPFRHRADPHRAPLTWSLRRCTRR